MAMLELTCPFDLVQNLESARERKQGKRNTKKYSLDFIDWEFVVFTAQLN